MSDKQSVAAIRSFGRTVDFGRTASDYRAFRAGFPAAFFDSLANRGYLSAGRRVIDLGTGTGTIARGLARRGLSVTGVDLSEAMLAEAAAIGNEEGVAVDYRQGSAETLTDTDASVDLVTAGQCWHWFDRPKAAAEAARVLVPSGRIVIAHFDWLPFAGNMVEATEALILAANPAWALSGGSGIYPEWLRDLAEASFTDIETYSFDVDVPYSHEAWRGRIRASAGVKATLSPDAIARFDAALAAILRDRFPDDPLSVPHRVWVATGVRR